MVISNNIPSIEEIANNTIVGFAITKEEVEKEDYNRIREFLNRVIQAQEKAKNKIILTFSGYENDEREIFWIDEINKYINQLFKEYPYLFYFLTNHQGYNKMILLCLNQTESVSNSITNETVTTMKVDNNLKQRIYDETINYAKNFKDDVEAKRIIDELYTNSANITNDDNNNKFKIMENIVREYWNGLVDEIEFKILTEKEAVDFIEVHKDIIDVCYNNKFTLIPVNGNLLNIFSFEDEIERNKCPICGEYRKILYKENIQKVLKNEILIPSYEDIINRNIKIPSQKLLEYLPIPIDYKKDKWICYNCKAINQFRYDKEIGLLF